MLVHSARAYEALKGGKSLPSPHEGDELTD